MSRFSGIDASDWSWGALFFDMDNDGFRDLIVGSMNFPINGKVYLYSDPSSQPDEVFVQLKVFLEGPYSSPTMNTNIGSDISLSQPFNSGPWNYTGTEAVTTNFLNDNNIVDWLLVQLRTGNSGSETTTIEATKAVLWQTPDRS